MASSIPGRPSGVRVSDLAIFHWHSGALLPNVSRWRWWWLRPQFRNEPQYLLEHLPWNRDLGHLEGDMATVAHDLRTNLDRLLLQARQRPVLDWLGVASMRRKFPRLQASAWSWRRTALAANVLARTAAST